MTVAATIAEMKDQEQVAANSGTGSQEKATSLGLQLSAIDPALRRRYHIPKEVEGAVVTNVTSDGSAATGRDRARRCHRPGRPEAGENRTPGRRGTEASRGQRQHSAAAEPPG